MKKEMPQWMVALIGLVVVVALAGVGFMVIGQPASGPGPNAKDLPKLRDQNRDQLTQNESKPPTGPAPSGNSAPSGRTREDVTNRGR